MIKKSSLTFEDNLWLDYNLLDRAHLTCQVPLQQLNVPKYTWDGKDLSQAICTDKKEISEFNQQKRANLKEIPHQVHW